jgi:hypothetical protein
VDESGQQKKRSCAVVYFLYMRMNRGIRKKMEASGHKIKNSPYIDDEFEFDPLFIGSLFC